MNTTQSQPTVVDLVLRGPRRGRSSVVTPSLAEATATPGLLITPHLGQDHPGGAWTFTGQWDVRHRRSGMQAAFVGGGLGHARDLAVLLGELDVDWTQPADRLPLREVVVRAAVARIRGQVDEAVRAGRPARTRPSSWVEVPPLYWIAARGDGHFVGDWFYRRWSDAADDLTNGQYENAVVVRDTATWWDLRCGAVDCPARLGLGLDDDGPMPDQGSVADRADDLGWHPLDHEHRHWLCSLCRPLFAQHRP